MTDLMFYRELCRSFTQIHPKSIQFHSVVIIYIRNNREEQMFRGLSFILIQS